MSLTTDIVEGILVAEGDLEDPVFTWNGVEYPCVPSIAEYTRTLDTGGFTTDRVLTMTARLLDAAGDELFAGALPSPQEIVTYQENDYRIISTKKHPTGAYLRIVAQGITRGI